MTTYRRPTNGGDDALKSWQDAFGNQLVRTTRNNADLASHYAYTPERYRFYRNGTRQVIHYDVSSVTDFFDKRANDEDVFILAPNGGDTLLFKTAERFRYTVNYVSEVSQSIALNQELTNTNDRITWGLDTSVDGDLSDGYFLEHLSSHDEGEIDAFIKRGGNVVGQRRNVTLEVAMSEFQRWQLDYNWYNVGQHSLTETYTTQRDGQFNNEKLIGSTESGDANAGTGGRGPISGNGHMVVEIEADASTTGLEAIVGSCSFTTLGGVGASVKAKGAETAPYTPSQTGSWEPVFAMRVDPNRPNVTTEIRGMDLTAGEGKLMAIACDPSNVLKADGSGGTTTLADSDFSRPEEHSDQNSVLQVTDISTVTQFPDNTGATQTTTANPGGYQLAFDTSRTSGEGNTQRQASANLQEKHGILDGDYAVAIVKPETTGTDMHVAYTVEMDE